ncbi:glycosyltransferase family 2 protein [Enterococcus sp. N249-2]
MSKNVVISIIIPIYNVENFLNEAIDSIMNQTYQNTEVILVNDGSTDNSLLIAQNYLKKDNRIKLINQSNKGLSGARNIGRKYATGKYIYFFDSDDYLIENTIEKCVSLLEKENADLIRFAANIHPASGSLANDFKSKIYEIPEKFDHNTLLIEEYLSQVKIFTPTVSLYVYRKSFLESNEIFFYEGILHEDELWTTQIFMSAEKISFISEKLFLRRYRENSIMVSKKNISKKGQDLLLISEELNKLKNLKLTNEKARLLKKRISRNLVVGTIQCKKSFRYLLQKAEKLNLSLSYVTIFWIAKNVNLAKRSLNR